MEIAGSKLGILIGCRPDQPSFGHALHIANAALNRSVSVYIYCIDEGVLGVGSIQLQALKERGASVYACAYGAHRHNIPLSDAATFAGLTVVNDIISGTDRFISFCK
jgi:hypothetical protein